ncbi:MAG TPA: hypothetical protein VI703_03380 [Anaerolineales bacterium]|jgi:hypothetical protein|nr:hypothetical protein [Anaerolineales bacterium]
MALGSLLLFLALLIIVGLIVAHPLFEMSEGEAEIGASGSKWLAERERVLDALAELDADWQLGKVPEEIYAKQREQLVAKGAQAIEEIEKTIKPVSRTKVKAGDDMEELIAAYKREVGK